jgi:hypothetical protein
MDCRRRAIRNAERGMQSSEFIAGTGRLSEKSIAAAEPLVAGWRSWRSPMRGVARQFPAGPFPRVSWMPCSLTNGECRNAREQELGGNSKGCCHLVPVGTIQTRSAELGDGGALPLRELHSKAGVWRPNWILRAGGFFDVPLAGDAGFRRAGKPGSTAGRDACRYGRTSKCLELNLAVCVFHALRTGTVRGPKLVVGPLAWGDECRERIASRWAFHRRATSTTLSCSALRARRPSTLGSR